jgi:hypothetical protein
VLIVAKCRCRLPRLALTNIHPKNDQIAFYDLPGYSSTTVKKEDYISEMKISDYDFVFIVFGNVLSEDEVWLVRALRKVGKLQGSHLMLFQFFL